MAKNKLPTTKALSTSRPEAVSFKQSKQDKDRERRYRTEDALRTMERARECEQDKQLMSDVRALANEKMQALKKI